MLAGRRLLALFLLVGTARGLVPQISPRASSSVATGAPSVEENEIVTRAPGRAVAKPVRWPKATYFNATSRYVKTTTTTVIDDNFDVIDPSPPAVFIASHSTERLVEEGRRKKVRHHHHHHQTGPTTSSPTGDSRHKWPGKVAPSRSKQHSTWSKNDILSPSTSGGSTPTLTPAICYTPASVCPAYRLIERRAEYEVRWYPSQKWVSAIVMTEDDRLLATWEGLHKLEQYFDGKNEQGATMNLTWPMLQQFKHGRHPGVLHRELRDVTLSVPVPARYQLAPPAPLTAEVLLDTVEASTLFVHSFRARLWELTDRALRHRAERLMGALREHGEAFHDRYFYLASFARPDGTESHVYEMWVHATRLREPGRARPATRSREPPLSKLTARTKRRLCRGVECPPFDVLRVYKFGIQKRRYFDTVLAEAGANECEFNSVAVWRGSMPLHLYKHGVNSHWEVLEATRPIGLVHVVEKSPHPSPSPLHRANSTFCRHNMTVALYLPKRLHSNPPGPGIGAPPVQINRISDLIVYVQTVGGSIMDPVRSAIEVKKFATRLRQLGLCFKAGEYYLVTYDFMVRFHGRQNEIWFLSDRCPPPVRRSDQSSS